MARITAKKTSVRAPKSAKQKELNSGTPSSKAKKSVVSGGAEVSAEASKVTLGENPRGSRILERQNPAVTPESLKGSKYVHPKNNKEAAETGAKPAKPSAKPAESTNGRGWWAQFNLDRKAVGQQRKENKRRERGNIEKADKAAAKKDEYVKQGANLDSKAAKIYHSYVKPWSLTLGVPGIVTGLGFGLGAYGQYLDEKENQQARENQATRNTLNGKTSATSTPAASRDTVQNVTDSTINEVDSISNVPKNSMPTESIGAQNREEAAAPKTPNSSVTKVDTDTNTAANNTSTHKVKLGDTLTKIAAENGLDVEKLLALNPQITNPDFIAVGDNIKLDGEPSNAELEVAKEKIKSNKKDKRKSKKINKASEDNNKNEIESEATKQELKAPTKSSGIRQKAALEWVKGYTDRIRNGEEPMSYDAMQNEVSDFLKQYDYLDE